MTDLARRGLTPEAVRERAAMGYTEAQAERRPGWWRARTRIGDGSWADIMELRDSDGQLIERMTMEDYRAKAEQDHRAIEEKGGLL